MYCTKCGSELKETSKFCPKCGVEVYRDNKKESIKSIFLIILGFFLPIVGFILFLVWKEKKPVKSSSTGWGSLLGLVFRIIVLIWIVLMIYIFRFDIRKTIIDKSTPTVEEKFYDMYGDSM